MAEANKKEPAAPAKQDKWLNWLAVTTVVFSAAATLSTFRGGGLSTRAVLAQSKASDQWSFYQAKSIKQHSYELQAELAELQAMSATGAQAEAYRKKIEQYKKKAATYEEDKAKIKAEAELLEAEKKRCQEVGGPFGKAMPTIQIAIMLSALAALMKKKSLWIVGCAAGLIGLGYFGYAYYFYLIRAALIAV